MRRLFALAARFAREIRASGWRVAVGKSVRHVVGRAGGAFRDQTDALERQLQEARAETAQLRDALEALRVSTDADRAEWRAHGPKFDDLQRRFELQIAALHPTLATQSEAIAWLAEHHWTAAAPESAGSSAPEPLVSVIMPVWNREALVGTSIRSLLAQTYQQWELLLIDDGSEDGTRAAIAEFVGDPRVRYIHQPHRGHAAARNLGLAQSRGEFIAYLDSDDVWYPPFLTRMVAALAAAPDRHCAYAAILMAGRPDGAPRILHFPLDRGDLRANNFISLMSFVHRRSLFERLGGFDEHLRRLVDWDLVLRYVEENPPLSVAVIAGCYRTGPWTRVSNQESLALATSQVRRNHVRRAPNPPRVLYACEFFPQLSETYVGTEITTLRRFGAEIEVYSESDPPVPGVSDAPVHRGDLRDAIDRFDPDIVHVHYLHRAFHVGPVAAAMGRPVTVRAHSFEFTPERLAELATRDEIRAVFQFPHLIPPEALAEGTKVHPMTCCFDPDLHFPGEQFDPRVVVRSGTANPHKDLPLFIRVAAKCPDHRFVLMAAWSVGYPDHLEELVALNRSLGSPVEIRANEPYARVIALTRQAGIHLHTFRMTEPYGMPVSIVEAMAAGCYPICRRHPSSLEFLAGSGATYDTEDQAAALIRSTAAWSADEWRSARLRAIERAYSQFVSDDVLRPLLEEWRALARARGRERQRTAVS